MSRQTVACELDHAQRKAFYSDIPDRLPEEIFETLASSGRVRIERIISDSHASPEGFWYDQDENEWVLLLKGSAALRFEGEERSCVLKPGDWVDIPAHVRHRVEWTDPKAKDGVAGGVLLKLANSGPGNGVSSADIGRNRSVGGGYGEDGLHLHPARESPRLMKRVRPGVCSGAIPEF